MKHQIGRPKAQQPRSGRRRRGGREGGLLSGREGDWVYFVVNGKQFRRRYVVPTDPRTPKQLRYRAALSAASKAWGRSNGLTEAQRDAYCAQAARVQSRGRLGQSGPLTGHQHFVGLSCAGLHQGLAPVPAQPKVGGRSANPPQAKRREDGRGRRAGRGEGRPGAGAQGIPSEGSAVIPQAAMTYTSHMGGTRCVHRVYTVFEPISAGVISGLGPE